MSEGRIGYARAHRYGRAGRRRIDPDGIGQRRRRWMEAVQNHERPGGLRRLYSAGARKVATTCGLAASTGRSRSGSAE